MQKPQSYALLKYQKDIKPLTYKQMMEGVHQEYRVNKCLSKKAMVSNIINDKERFVYNPDRWLPDIEPVNMFPVPHLSKWFDLWVAENPYLIGFFFGAVVTYFIGMLLIAKYFGGCFRY